MNYFENLSEKMKETLKKVGYTSPTPIQEQSIEALLQKKDFIGLAQTGTGKTAAFAVPAIERLFEGTKKTQVLVLCPTRELALQTTEVFRKLSEHKHIRTISVYGGQPVSVQVRAIRAGAQVIVGTPGRVKDLINKNVIKLKNIRTAVLDEADEMLDFGFLPDIKFILSSITEPHQTVLFSATMNSDIAKIASQFLNEPVRIEVGKRNEPTKTVQQSYMTTEEAKKVAAVSTLLEQSNPRLALIFCNTRRRVKNLARILDSQGIRIACLHGDLTQSQRDAIMATFRSGRVDVLVATDVAARGIDVDKIDLVINYDVPDKLDYYVHRIGRTGRAGNSGMACTLVSPRERCKIKDIEKRFSIKLKKEVS